MHQKLTLSWRRSLSYRGEFITGVSSSRDEISSRQKRVNNNRHFTIDRDDFISGWNFTCKHRVEILRKQIYDLQVSFYWLQSNFTSCKFILRVGNKISRFELLFMSSKFQKIILWIASCFFMSWKFKIMNLRAERLKWWCLRVAKLSFTSWTFKMPILSINLTFESNFKGTTLR